jgi:hypothetical protein
MGEYLNDSVVVIARDKDGKPVPGVTVQFYTECDDCGSLDPINKKTDKKGMFAAKWWLGKTEGTKYAKAKFLIYDDIPPVTFTATAKNIVPSFIYVESGNYQQPKTNQFLDKPVKVKVVDKNGTPVKGASVHFEPGCDDCGVTENTILQTDKNGIAQTRWKIGNQKITNKLKAEVMNYPDIQPVYFYTGDGNNLRQQLIDMSPWKEVFDNGDYWLLYFTENSLKYEEYDKKNGAWELTDSFTNNWGIISDGSIFIEEEDDDDDNFIFRVNITGKTLTISFFCIDNSLVDDDDCDDGVEAILTSQK